MIQLTQKHILCSQLNKASSLLLPLTNIPFIAKTKRSHNEFFKRKANKNISSTILKSISDESEEVSSTTTSEVLNFFIIKVMIIICIKSSKSTYDYSTEEPTLAGKIFGSYLQLGVWIVVLTFSGYTGIQRVTLHF